MNKYNQFVFQPYYKVSEMYAQLYITVALDLDAKLSVDEYDLILERYPPAFIYTFFEFSIFNY